MDHERLDLRSPASAGTPSVGLDDAPGGSSRRRRSWRSAALRSLPGHPSESATSWSGGPPLCLPVPCAISPAPWPACGTTRRASSPAWCARRHSRDREIQLAADDHGLRPIPASMLPALPDSPFHRPLVRLPAVPSLRDTLDHLARGSPRAPTAIGKIPSIPSVFWRLASPST